MGVLLKLAVFAVAAYLAWSVVRGWFRSLTGKAVPPQRPAPPPVEPRGPAKRVVEDASACPVCAAYVSSGAAKCGRPDCPQT